MTDRRTLAIDERAPIPGVGLLGPDMSAFSDPGSAALSAGASGPGAGRAPVDGVAVLFFDPSGRPPHLVFVSRGLAALVGNGQGELLGRSTDALFGPEAGRVEAETIRRTLVGEDSDDGRSAPGSPTSPGGVGTSASSRDGFYPPGGGALDLSDNGRLDMPLDLTTEPARVGEPPHPARHPSRNPRRTAHHSTRLLRSSGRADRPVHITYTALPSAAPGAPYILAEFRDLGRDTAERLLADQSAVVGSLARGHELGRLCHQVVTMVEDQLGDGSACLLGLTDPAGELEPVVVGGLPFDTAANLMRTIARSSAVPMKRIVSAEGLPIDQARSLRTGTARTIWFHPIVAAGGKLVGAFLIVTEQPKPDDETTAVIDHLATVMSTAIEHSSTEADYQHQALHDPLTKLPNRALLVDRIEQAMALLERDGIAMSVLLVDIDRFRAVNDTLGPEAGDRVLLEVAGRLLAAVRLGDTVGRVGNDQYLVMCVATNGELDASAVARRILRSLSEPIRLDDAGGTQGEDGPAGHGIGGEIRITASIGVAVIEEAGASAVTVIGNAESALRQANAAGRGQYAMFEAELRQDALARHEIEQALHRAITGNELVVHYQPIVEVRSGFVVGAEALIRWARPGHDLLYPGSFIQIAEESELIIPMGNWIIDQVCADLADWPPYRGRSPLVTVNLSSRQLSADTLVPTVVSALRRNDLRPERLGFEITESMAIEDMDAASTNLNRLSELGCRIAIDDFGIGHATLDYLRQFSMADALKIDRSFIDGFGSVREDTAIVHASMALASSLEMQVIAEGVEDLDQLTGLEEVGCRYAQGYALGRPVPYKQMIDWWGQGRAFIAITDDAVTDETVSEEVEAGEAVSDEVEAGEEGAETGEDQTRREVGAQGG